MSIFLPKVYQKDIYAIDYDKLYIDGIRCILFDLDNTLVAIDVKKPDNNLIDHFNKLKEKGFKILIFSNSPSIRIRPFKEKLDIDVVSFALKPFKRNFKKVLKKYNLKANEVAIVGDQLLTDILGGNKVGITTILIDQISEKDGIFTIINRLVEKKIYRKLKNNNFEKGKYYE